MVIFFILNFMTRITNHLSDTLRYNWSHGISYNRWNKRTGHFFIDEFRRPIATQIPQAISKNGVRFT